jgi:hypothetical protein
MQRLRWNKWSFIASPIPAVHRLCVGRDYLFAASFGSRCLGQPLKKVSLELGLRSRQRSVRLTRNIWPVCAHQLRPWPSALRRQDAAAGCRYGILMGLKISRTKLQILPGRRSGLFESLEQFRSLIRVQNASASYRTIGHTDPDVAIRRHQQENIHEERSLMGAARRRRRGLRKSNPGRRQQRSNKRFEAWPPEIIDDESVEPEKTDRLLFSALRYWEVERDLIEERMAASGR